jgi:hypothetical protein
MLNWQAKAISPSSARGEAAHRPQGWLQGSAAIARATAP